MSLHFVKPDLTYFEQYEEMYREWKNQEHINPWFFNTKCQTLDEFANFVQMLDNYEKANVDRKYASQTSYFVVDENDRLIGGASIRHYLTVDGYNYGGHIGYGVRPSERRKGYGTEILKLSLEEAKVLKLTKVLLVALETNTGSNKVIQKCGGVLENKIKDSNNSVINRYWIHISK